MQSIIEKNSTKPDSRRELKVQEMGQFQNPLAETKSWDKSLEAQIFNRWEAEGIGKFDVNSSKPLFVMDTPPPYPSGRPWHVGGASHYSQIDMIARSARMRAAVAI